MDKKNEVTVENLPDCLELDELYWFSKEKGNIETRENVYIMTAVSRHPKQIVGFDVASDKTSARIQDMIDNSAPAQTYCNDGYVGYLDVAYPWKYIRNIRDKSDTFIVEGVNSDLRHYIPLIAWRSRCFARKIETLKAVLKVFVAAYNRFGVAKMNFRKNRKSRELPFSVLDFL